MIVRATRLRVRSGITLTEILISILILGVGVTSLATLFPLGLIRLQKAQQLSRGGFLVESAIADLGTRNLLSPLSFIGNPTIAQCYSTTSGFYNPWVQDTPGYGTDYYGDGIKTNGVFRGYGGLGTFNSSLPLAFQPGAGLPVAYDPLWRAVANGTGVYPIPLSAKGTPEARFGQGVGFTAGGTTQEWLRLDPDGNPAGAHGLQRITNLSAAFAAAAVQTFVSPEDVVLQDPKGVYLQDPTSGAFVDSSTLSPAVAATLGSQLAGPNPSVPALQYNGTTKALMQPNYDFRFTWLFTGQLADSGNGTVFSGDVVICSNRQFGIDPGINPFGVAANVYQTTGETVVEAVWGYSGGVTGPNSAANRTVLLRWPIGMADPDLKVGMWIADVTYVRNQTDATNRYGASIYPAQRCYWYQIAKRTDPAADSMTGFRSLTVWTSTPLRAFTQQSGGTPVHVESALIMPSVVNVYPRTIYTR
jgi:type II secretory pathway pseudopilin PulG